MIPCPSCGFIVFPGPAGSFDVCPVCGWEDDESMLGNPCVPPTEESLCLSAWQAQTLRRFPRWMSEYHGYRRDPCWRPLTHAEILYYATRAAAIDGGEDLDESVFYMEDAYWNKSPVPRLAQ